MAFESLTENLHKMYLKSLEEKDVLQRKMLRSL